MISDNSLNDLYTSNNVSVSSLESIIAIKRHCGVFIDIPLYEINKQCDTTLWYYTIPIDIIFSEVLDLNQFNSIFNSFPVLTCNYASFYL